MPLHPIPGGPPASALRSPDASRQRGGRFLNGRFAGGAGEPAGQATGAAE
ncbi:MAG: hypothetical protein ACLSAH_07645 [Bilophila wadsworthia]